MQITRNRTYLVEPVRAIVVARDAKDAETYAGPGFKVTPCGSVLPTWSIHYTDAARRLDTYA